MKGRHPDAGKSGGEQTLCNGAPEKMRYIMSDSSSPQEACGSRKHPLWGSVTAFILGLFIGLTFLAQTVDPFTADNRIGALVVAILTVVFAAIAMAGRHRVRFMAIIGLALGVLGIIEYLPS